MNRFAAAFMLILYAVCWFSLISKTRDPNDENDIEFSSTVKLSTMIIWFIGMFCCGGADSPVLVWTGSVLLIITFCSTIFSLFSKTIVKKIGKSKTESIQTKYGFFLVAAATLSTVLFILVLSVGYARNNYGSTGNNGAARTYQSGGNPSEPGFPFV